MSAPLDGVLMTKVGRPGAVKTRLQPLLGEEGAAKAHLLLLDAVLAGVAASGLRLAAAVDGALDGPEGAALRARLLAAGMPHFPQAEGDLGARLRAAMRRAVPDPRRRVLAIGGDSPLVDPAWLRAAAAASAPVALGPSGDGGYWVVSAGGPEREALLGLLTEDLPWSTPALLARTRERLAAEGVPCALLPQADDVDTPDDLRRLLADPRCPAALRDGLSALLPPEV